MKRLVRTLFLAGVLMALLCVTAMAAEGPSEAGIYVTEGNAIVQPLKADKTEALSISTTIDGKTVTLFTGAERLKVTVSTDGNSQYLIFALKDGATMPAAGNIVYINQESATGSTIEFDVYPSELVSGKTYDIYTSSSNSGLDKIASFAYYAPYLLGNVTNDAQGIINISDALAVIDHIADRKTLEGTSILAADVTQDGLVNISDALRIIDYIAERITSFSK